MGRKIIGVTVGTPISPEKMEKKIKPVKTINGVSPDASGNVDVAGGSGATFTPSVSSDGVLSWTNDKGLNNPASVNIKGADGKTAYQYAKDGGFKGTESEFIEKLNREIPSKLSEFNNDSGFITAIGAPVQSVNGKTGAIQLSASDVGARPTSWTPTYSETGAEKSGTAETKISLHDTNTNAHNDIRIVITGLTDRLNTLANSDDTTLDQMKEVVDYIKSNRGLIEQITTNKVNYTDIINNLTSNVSNKPLSAAQGVALKALIDSITIVSSVEESTESGGSNVVTFSDGKTLTVKNGKDGYTPQKNIDYFDGKDYVLTEADKAEIVREVIESLGGNPVFGYVDENNNIILSGNIVDGSYSVKYEMEDGSTIDIGQLVLEEEPDEPTVSYTNLADPTSADWANDTRYSGSTETFTKECVGSIITNYIPAKKGDVIRVKGLNLYSLVGSNHSGVVTFNNDKMTPKVLYTSATVTTSPSQGAKDVVTLEGDVFTYTILLRGDGTQMAPDNTAYIRISAPLQAGYTSDDVIITINEPISE